MRFAGRAAAASWRILLLSLFSTTTVAKDDTSKLISYTHFTRPPLNINYFEDSDVVVFHDVEERNIYRLDDETNKWKQVEGIPDGYASMLVRHPFEKKTAYVLTQDTKHFKTTDRGKTWSQFSSGTYPSPYQPRVLVFHADDPDRVIFNGIRCDGLWCDVEEATYTLDGFKSVKQLRAATSGCWWAKSTKEFTSRDKDIDQSRTLCISADPLSVFKEDQRLAVSDNFFALEKGDKQEFEPNLDTTKGVSGIVNLATVKGYILVAAASQNSDEMALFVTNDTIHWHRAIFPSDDSHDHSHQITQEAYTVLESTEHSIQVDVLTSHPSRPMGVLFTSNSNGTFFTENVPYTNRNVKGHVDFEKISGIDGIFLVNTVENGKDVDKSGADKIIVTQITYTDGRTFHEIKAGDERIHLHSVTQLDNVGRVFSSPAPGLIMGNGNTGKALTSFAESNLYVSGDAGLTWKKALDGPHKYEFGDSGSILVAIQDSAKENVTNFHYSTDHGDTWESVDLPDEIKSIRPDLLTTTPDSTSTKFLLLGERDRVYYMIVLDFSTLGKRKCDKDKDMEDWYARVDEDGKPTCIMGNKQTYRRRKKSADCFVLSDFVDPVAETERCDCTDRDYECDFNFQRDPDDNTVCNRVGPIPIPAGSCPNGSKGTFKGSSGWRLIPGNACKPTGGSQKDDPVDRECSDGATFGGGGSKAPDTPANGEVSHKSVEFSTELSEFEKIYLGGQGTDETIIVRPLKWTSAKDDILWRTTNHGKSWERILVNETILSIYQHDYFKEVVFFTTDTEKVIYTIDHGHTFHTFKVPNKAATGVASISFHPDKKDWLIWVGETCDDLSGSSKNCFREASLSTDRGDNWNTIRRFVDRCEFTGHSAYKKYTDRSQKQIVCLVMKEERNDSEMTLMTSNDFFDEDRVFFNGTVQHFATMSEFILISNEDDKGVLQALASVDGKHFEAARFPYNFGDTHQNSYTVLDSSSHAINLFVGTSSTEGHKYGSIIKSNSNGTTYVLSASQVNGDDVGYVDFEKVAGLEGLVMINVVANPKDKSGKKEVRTKISHDDGSKWDYLKPPAKDADGKAYKCSSSKGTEKCALHLHGYTERDDKRRTFGASSAIGLLFGVGNVGSKLEVDKESDTFMSSDGGLNWKSVKKGHWTWQYGDQGSIIVLAQRATHGNNVKTKSVWYSINAGETWKSYDFSDKEVIVTDLTTVRSGASRNFLIWCKPDSGNPFAVNLDFTGLSDKACSSEGDDSDYYTWSPKHPLNDDDCLFGHVATYLRKKPDRTCYNDESLQKLHKYVDCKCDRQDFEW